MRITYLLTTADLMGGTERAIFTQAGLLAAHHEVRVLSVFKMTDKRFFASDDIPVDYLVDASVRPARPVRTDHGLTDDEIAALAGLPSALIARSWESAFTGLADVELQHALGSLDTDVLVASTPPLLAAAIELAPPSVIVVDQEHRATQMRGDDLEPLRIYGPQADALVSLTAQSTAYCRTMFGASGPHLATIPNSLPDVFRPRSSLTNKLVMTAGRFVLGKQFGHLIAAWRLVVDQEPDWKLRIYGDGPLMENYRRQIDQLSLGNNVELPGPVPDMTAEWSKASIFAGTSRSEGQGLAAVEAAAAGVPIVSYDCPTGPAEIIDNDRNGLLVPLDDIRGLAAALLRLIRDDELRATLGANALDSASRYGPEVVRDLWLDFFAQLLAERDADGPGTTRLRRAARRGVARELERRAAAPAAVPAAKSVEMPKPTRIVGEPLTVETARTDNLRRVLSALRDNGITHFVVPGYEASIAVVGVREDARDAVLEALATHEATRETVVSTVDDRYRVESRRPAAQVPPIGRRADPVIRVHRPVSDPTAALVLGTRAGCDVEFWSEAATRPGLLVPPRRNRLIDELPLAALDTLPVAEVAGLRTASLAGLGGLAWDAIDFPIDVVYTWVDGDDPAWRERKNAYAGDSADLHVEAVSEQRFTSRDELKYSLRSIEQHAPWVRDIYLVTDQQVPDWLVPDHDRLKVVDHRDIFTDPSLLPTFNSHAIESQLHHIDGLGEHFLYFNDDVMLGRFVDPSLFFTASGTTMFFPSSVKLNYDGDPPPHILAGRRTRELLERDFGRTTAQCMMHTPSALRRSILQEIEERYAPDVNATAAQRFRGDGDVSIPSSLYPYYAYLTDRALPSALEYSYISLGQPSVPELMVRNLRRRDQDVIAIGDPLSSTWSVEEQYSMARSFLTEYFPVPSSFER